MKILLLIPQNVIPNNNGGKTSIYMPMVLLASIYNLRAVVFCDANEYFNKDDYGKLNVDATQALINKQDSAFSVLLNIGAKQPFKFAKYHSIKHLRLIEEICVTWTPDIIICHHAHLAEYCRKLKIKFPHIQLILREHNVEYLLVQQFYQHQNNRLLKAFAYWQYMKTKQYEQRCWRYFDNVIFISDTDFRHYTLSNTTNGSVIYDGTKVTAINKQVLHKGEAFLFSGSIASYQNRFNLHNFVHLIWIPWKEKYSHSASFELWITGDRDKQVVEYALKLSPVDKQKYGIRILGFVDNLVEVMTKCTFFLSPTILGAGLRIKVIEAMAMGCVIFLTEVDLDMAKPIKPNINVILYRDIASFDEQVKILMENNTFYNNISQQAIETVKENFTWNIFLKKFQSIFKSNG